MHILCHSRVHCVMNTASVTRCQDDDDWLRPLWNSNTLQKPMGDVIDTTPMFYSRSHPVYSVTQLCINIYVLADTFSRELLVQKPTMFVKINAWFEILETRLGNLEKDTECTIFTAHTSYLAFYTLQKLVWVVCYCTVPNKMVLKCPYYGLWKVHILVLGVTDNRFTCMHGQKTLSLSYNVHLFSPYLLNDSQTIRSMIHFSKPLLCVTLICGDRSEWFYFHSISPVMPDKAAFVRAVLFVYSVTGETAILPLQKRHLVTKNELAFSFRPRRKDQQVGGNMLMFHVDVNMKRLGIRFKNDSFQWFRVDCFFWETITLYMVHFT